MLSRTPWVRSASPLAKVGVELTDSIYVVLNMNIMTRMGADAFKNLGDTSNDFVRGLHCKADVDPEKRYIVQFPEENTIWSINSAYGGNVLLGKKCFALRIASYQGKNEGWMAEHMLILGVQKPDGEIEIHHCCFPVCLRQDQPGYAHSAGSVTRSRAMRFTPSATISHG